MTPIRIAAESVRFSREMRDEIQRVITDAAIARVVADGRSLVTPDDVWAVALDAVKAWAESRMSKPPEPRP